MLTAEEKEFYYIDLGVAKKVLSVRINGVSYTADSTFTLSIGHNSFITDKVYYIAEKSGVNHLFVATQFVALYPAITINGAEYEYSTTPVSSELTSEVTASSDAAGLTVTDSEIEGIDYDVTLLKTVVGNHGAVKIQPYKGDDPVTLTADSIILCKIEYDYADESPNDVRFAFTTADLDSGYYYLLLYILYGADLTQSKYAGATLSFTYYVDGSGYGSVKFQILVPDT